MNDLVFLKRNDVFTDSMIIAQATENQHESVARIIKKHGKELEKFGRLEFTDLKSGKRGRPTKVCLLTEPQATLLITFLDNNDITIRFKVELVRQFFEMRKFIAERNTADWIATRRAGMLTRREETDVIKQLVEYAKAQGSTHPDKLYMVYSRLANRAVGISSRDNATVLQLNNLMLFENIALCMIRDGMTNGKDYKQIYQDTKKRFESVQALAFLQMAS